LKLLLIFVACKGSMQIIDTGTSERACYQLDINSWAMIHEVMWEMVT